MPLCLGVVIRTYRPTHVSRGTEMRANSSCTGREHGNSKGILFVSKKIASVDADSCILGYIYLVQSTKHLSVVFTSYVYIYHGSTWHVYVLILYCCTSKYTKYFEYILVQQYIHIICTRIYKYQMPQVEKQRCVNHVYYCCI